jgi:hypothetical protein
LNYEVFCYCFIFFVEFRVIINVMNENRFNSSPSHTKNHLLEVIEIIDLIKSDDTKREV